MRYIFIGDLRYICVCVRVTAFVAFHFRALFFKKRFLLNFDNVNQKNMENVPKSASIVELL